VSTADQRIYVGRLDRGRPAVYSVGATSVERLHPAGSRDFQWGCGYADAAHELARVLLTDATGSEQPAEACHRFAEQILLRLPHDGFALQRETVEAWLRRFVTV
jgi:Family of unknown function (DUF6166)